MHLGQESSVVVYGSSQAVVVSFGKARIDKFAAKELLGLRFDQIIEFDPVLGFCGESFGAADEQLNVGGVLSMGARQRLYLIAELAEEVVGIGYRNDMAFPMSD